MGMGFNLVWHRFTVWSIVGAVLFLLVAAFHWTVRDWRRAGLPLPWEHPTGPKR
jgi:hypothetical protein